MRSKQTSAQHPPACRCCTSDSHNSCRDSCTGYSAASRLSGCTPASHYRRVCCCCCHCCRCWHVCSWQHAHEHVCRAIAVTVVFSVAFLALQPGKCLPAVAVRAHSRHDPQSDGASAVLQAQKLQMRSKRGMRCCCCRFDSVKRMNIRALRRLQGCWQVERRAQVMYRLMWSRTLLRAL